MQSKTSVKQAYRIYSRIEWTQSSTFAIHSGSKIFQADHFELFLSHVVPIHTKNDKQCIENYGPVCFLLFNELYKFFNENDLLSSNQSGFQPGESCLNQSLSITHEIYQSFDNDLEVRRVFLDISLIKLGMMD